MPLRFNSGIDLDDILSNPVICITGTGTGIGKTIVTGLLASTISKSQSVVTQKWVQSGDLDSPDIATHDVIACQNIDPCFIPDRQVYSFNQPVSPHLAARLNQTHIDLLRLQSATQRLSSLFQSVLVETSGGVMVPLSNTETMGDLIVKMNLPTIVVIPNQLGTINHALLTLQYLKQRNVSVLGFILNNFSDHSDPLYQDNPRIIESMSEVIWLGTVQGVNLC